MAPARVVDECDVLVVGAGTAAYEAAVAARDAGADRVVMLEKAPAEQSGGNARFSHTGFRFTYDGPDDIRPFIPHVDRDTFARMDFRPYTAADFRADLDRVCGQRIDPVLADRLVADSFAAVDWMRGLGIPWEPDTSIEVDGKLHFEPGIPLAVAGGGKGQLARWQEIAQARRVEVRYRSKVTSLLGDQAAVEGVVVSDPDGRYELRAGSVILCAGGFQASAEMRARYLGPGADLMKVRGSRHDTGEVLLAALGIGARSAGQWQGAHATPVDASFPDLEMSNTGNRYSYRNGVTVNADGRRFFDEGEAEHSYTYAKTGWAVIRERGGRAYQIFDRTGTGLLRWQYVKHAEPIERDTLGGLAEAIGVDPGALEATIAEFNAAVDERHAFDPSTPDHRGTTGLTPPKSNWAVRIDTPPYRAYPVTGGITFTFGGLAIDQDARVQNTAGEPIRGLYASGDIVGLFFFNYPSCTGQTRNVVFSRLAAHHAVLGGAQPSTA